MVVNLARIYSALKVDIPRYNNNFHLPLSHSVYNWVQRCTDNEYTTKVLATTSPNFKHRIRSPLTQSSFFFFSSVSLTPSLLLRFNLHAHDHAHVLIPSTRPYTQARVDLLPFACFKYNCNFSCIMSNNCYKSLCTFVSPHPPPPPPRTNCPASYVLFYPFLFLYAFLFSCK